MKYLKVYHKNTLLYVCTVVYNIICFVFSIFKIPLMAGAGLFEKKPFPGAKN
jgi:hypothetical protein